MGTFWRCWRKGLRRWVGNEVLVLLFPGLALEFGIGVGCSCNLLLRNIAAFSVTISLGYIQSRGGAMVLAWFLCTCRGFLFIGH